MNNRQLTYAMSQEPAGVAPVGSSHGSHRGSHSAPEPQKPLRHKPSRKAVGITIGVVAAVLVCAYLGMAVFFMSHFGFNTTLNGHDISFQTVDQVESLLEDQVDGYVLKLDESDGSSEELSGASFGLTYAPDESASELLSEQNPFAWIMRVFATQGGSELHPSVSFNSDELKSAVDALKLMNPDNMTAPVDATVGYDDSTSRYVVKPAQLGTTINTDTIYSAVEAAVDDTEDSLDLVSADCYVKPTVTEDDPALAEKADACNKYAKSSITYDLGDAGSLVLDGNTIVNWIAIADDGTVGLDDDAIADWVSTNLAKPYDTVGSDRSFTTHSGETITVSGGNYGWEINQEDEVAQIKEDVESQSAVSREPVWSSKAYSHGANEWGDTYIEVSIPEQHLWFYQNGEVVMDSDVVTGLPSGKRKTITGVYGILEKESPSVLRGPQRPDGSYEWESHVKYWMRITWSGTGFHDADGWRSSYGGSIYKTNGSHGCINMPASAASQLYDYVELGTPAILYGE